MVLAGALRGLCAGGGGGGAADRFIPATDGGFVGGGPRGGGGRGGGLFPAGALAGGGPRGGGGGGGLTLRRAAAGGGPGGGGGLDTAEAISSLGWRPFVFFEFTSIFMKSSQQKSSDGELFPHRVCLLKRQQERHSFPQNVAI